MERRKLMEIWKARQVQRGGVHFDDDGEWITANGTHIHIGENGEVDKGPASLKKALSNGGAKSSGKTKNPSETYKPGSDGIRFPDGSNASKEDIEDAVAYNYGLTAKQAKKMIENGELTNADVQRAVIHHSAEGFNPSEKSEYIRSLEKEFGVEKPKEAKTEPSDAERVKSALAKRQPVAAKDLKVATKSDLDQSPTGTKITGIIDKTSGEDVYIVKGSAFTPTGEKTIWKINGKQFDPSSSAQIMDIVHGFDRNYELKK